MKVFISWSGNRSRLLAESLHNWITLVINAIEPWMSTNDLNPGTRWSFDLASELEKTSYGIICVTSDNINSPWLMFEAGALSKQVEKSRVVPVLLDIKPSDIQGPLAQFQSIEATEDGIRRMVASVNSIIFQANERSLSESMLAQAFNLWWPKLQERIDNIPPLAITEKQEKKRSEREIIEETLLLVRNISQQIESISSPIDSSFQSLLDDPRSVIKSEWAMALRDLGSKNPKHVLVALQALYYMSDLLNPNERKIAYEALAICLSSNEFIDLEIEYKKTLEQLSP